MTTATQSAVHSIDLFDLSNGKVYYRFDKYGRRSGNCISLVTTATQTAVHSIDLFHLSNGKVYYRFDKCGRRSDNCISLVTMATRCMIVKSIDSFDWWEWLFHSRFHIKSLSNRRIHLSDDYKQMYILKTQNGVEINAGKKQKTKKKRLL